jgi:prepilin-type N-terminal cleavage/methylation domain-containing protein
VSRNESGYTLIELVIVIALAGVLVAASLTGIGGRGDLARFSTQVEEIKDVIRRTQNETMSGKADGLAPGESLFGTRVVFAGSSYSIDRTADSSSWTTVATVNLPQGIEVSEQTLFIAAPSSRSSSVATYSTTFNNMASYDPTDQTQRQTVVIELTARGNHRATITVDTFSNRLSSQIIQ